MPASLLEKYKDETIPALFARHGKRQTSQDIYGDVVLMARAALETGQGSRRLILQLRLAIELSPYSPELAQLISTHDQLAKGLAEHSMPQLAQALAVCAEKQLPLPLIVSCARYMDKALALQKQLREHMWGLTPIIIRGDMGLNEEKFDGPVLSLPVADSYEALPLKMAEAFIFFQALAPKTGIIKIDDDLKCIGGAPDIAQARSVFGTGDYIGVAVDNPAHDRLWHYGKCAGPVPPIYGKPVKAPWARGALYYLSPHAVEKAAAHFMRFPGCLAGGYYEDKAVGDALFDNGVKVTPTVLENLLRLDSRHEHR